MIESTITKLSKDEIIFRDAVPLTMWHYADPTSPITFNIQVYQIILQKKTY